MKYRISEINAMDAREFVRVVGPVFEHSSWIAEEAAAQRPFASVEILHDALCKIVLRSSDAKQIALIRAHPDLAGRLALQKKLTTESTSEQAAAGLENLTPEEIVLFQKLNTEYRKNFGFPFVICARLNKKEAILKGFLVRLKNSRPTEIKTALNEIFKIAELRLKDLFQPRG